MYQQYYGTKRRKPNYQGQRPTHYRRKAREKTASREEQHARLIDCGWENWDDRGD